MQNTYPKKTKEKLSDHFFTTDFDCHCTLPACTETLIDPNLVIALEELWTAMGAFIMTSCYRCEKHNASVGGGEKSQHLLGKASDLKSTKSYNGPLMAKFAEQVKLFRLGGIGTYSRFPNLIHVDIGPRRRWAK